MSGMMNVAIKYADRVRSAFAIHKETEAELTLDFQIAQAKLQEQLEDLKQKYEEAIDKLHKGMVAEISLSHVYFEDQSELEFTKLLKHIREFKNGPEPETKKPPEGGVETVDSEPPEDTSTKDMAAKLSPISPEERSKDPD